MAFSPTLSRRWIGNRTLSIRVTPPPITFAERRSILQVIEQHGSVEYLKAIPGHDAIYVSVMKDDESVNALVQQSPLSYSVAAPNQTKETYLADLVRPESLEKLKPNPTVEGAGASPPAGEDAEEKKFVIHLWPHPEYNHVKNVAVSPLYLTWPESTEKRPSVWTKALQQSVPKTVATSSLSIWNPDLGKERMENATFRGRRDRFSKFNWIPSKMKAGSGRDGVPEATYENDFEISDDNPSSMGVEDRN